MRKELHDLLKTQRTLAGLPQTLELRCEPVRVMSVIIVPLAEIGAASFAHAIIAQSAKSGQPRDADKPDLRSLELRDIRCNPPLRRGVAAIHNDDQLFVPIGLAQEIIDAALEASDSCWRGQDEPETRN